MTTFELLFLTGGVGIVLFMALLSSGRTGTGDWMLAMLVAAGFMAFSLIPVLKEGPFGFVANHTGNFWGVQVWFDLVLALGTALFLAAPRARRVGMTLAPWLIPVLLSGSIGLFVLLARLFWLERQQPAQG